jgi:hypothetical protein
MSNGTLFDDVCVTCVFIIEKDLQALAKDADVSRYKLTNIDSHKQKSNTHTHTHTHTRTHTYPRTGVEEVLRAHSDEHSATLSQRAVAR